MLYGILQPINGRYCLIMISHDANTTFFLTKEEAQERYNICKQCDSFIPLTSQCKECGCLMKIKAKIRNSDCPLSKWKN